MKTHYNDTESWLEALLDNFSGYYFMDDEGRQCNPWEIDGELQDHWIDFDANQCGCTLPGWRYADAVYVFDIKDECEDKIQQPVMFEWQEFSKWRWVSKDQKVYDHEDPSLDPDDLNLDRYAFYPHTADSSNGHIQIECSLMVPGEESDKAEKILSNAGIKFTKELIDEETELTDDYGNGALVSRSSLTDSWYWQER